MVVNTTSTPSLIPSCPQCRQPLYPDGRTYSCAAHHQYPVVSGILDVMSIESQARLLPFMAKYEMVRSAERWGDGSANYYQHLPFRDVTGFHEFEWRIKRASYLELLRQLRAREAQTILDTGAGNCWLSHRLWLEGFHGAATDIRVDDYDGMAAVRRYWPKASQWFRMRIDFGEPGFMPGQFDAVIFNASLHYTPDPLPILRRYLPLLTSKGAIYVIDSPVYTDRTSGDRMMEERVLEFRSKYGIELTNSTQSYYLTFDLLSRIADDLQCTLHHYTPRYGWRWHMRPIIATMLRRREPAHFGVFVFEKG